MVDFGIYLAGNTPCNGPQTLQERLASAPYLTSPSINHTNRLSLQAKPLAISIETKTISRTEEEARVQLGVWIASQIERLKRLCLEPSPVLAETVFPLLFVQSAQWTVMFARVDPENLNRVVSGFQTWWTRGLISIVYQHWTSDWGYLDAEGYLLLVSWLEVFEKFCGEGV